MEPVFYETLALVPQTVLKLPGQRDWSPSPVLRNHSQPFFMPPEGDLMSTKGTRCLQGLKLIRGT